MALGLSATVPSLPIGKNRPQGLCRASPSQPELAAAAPGCASSPCASCLGCDSGPGSPAHMFIHEFSHQHTRAQGAQEHRQPEASGKARRFNEFS